MKKIYNKNKFGIFIFTILALISAGAMVFSGYVVSYMVNTAVDIINGTQKSMNNLFILIGICALSFSIFIIFSFIAKAWKIKIIKKFNIYLRFKITQKIINLSLSELDEKNNGDLISWLTNDITQIENKVFNNLFNFIESLLTAFLSIIAIFLLNWIVGLATILSFFILMIVPGLLQKSMVKTITNVSTKQEEFSSKVENTIAGYKELLYANKTNIFSEIISEKSLDLENYKQKNENLKNLQITGIISVSSICQIGLLILTVILASIKIAPIGVVFAVPQLAGNFLNNGQQTLQSLFEMLGSKELFKKFEFIVEDHEHKEIEDFESININNLTLKINDNTLYNNLTVKIEKNKKYLLYGPSGVGKSTLMKIMFGALFNYEGKLLWNNKKEFTKIDKVALWNQIYYVQQEATIFDGNFKDNVTLFDETISEEEIWNVIKKVNLEPLVNKNNGSLEFNCKDVSKGEQQRISIARALLSKKNVIYLDEPTASLDKQNAKLVEQLILEDPNLTVLFISHTLDIKSQLFDEVIKL